MEEVSPVIAVSWTLQKLADDRVRTMSMTRKFSGIGVPIVQMCSFRVRSCSDVSAKGVDVEN